MLRLVSSDLLEPLTSSRREPGIREVGLIKYSKCLLIEQSLEELKVRGELQDGNICVGDRK